jgi:anti-anti-sigma factor
VALASGTVVVTICGDIDRSGARHLEEILKDLIENQENRPVVVDLRNVARLDPAGVAALLVATNHAHRRGGAFAVDEPCSSVCESLEGAGLAEIIPLASRRAPGGPPASGSARRHPSRDGGS